MCQSHCSLVNDCPDCTHRFKCSLNTSSTSATAISTGISCHHLKTNMTETTSVGPVQITSILLYNATLVSKVVLIFTPTSTIGKFLAHLLPSSWYWQTFKLLQDGCKMVYHFSFICIFWWLGNSWAPFCMTVGCVDFLFVKYLSKLAAHFLSD